MWNCDFGPLLLKLFFLATFLTTKVLHATSYCPFEIYSFKEVSNVRNF